MNKSINLYCCRCTSCETQILSEEASPDEHDCTLCDTCYERMLEMAAPVKIKMHIEAQRDKIKQYQSLASRLDVSHILQREKTILRRLEERLAGIA